MYLAAPVLIGSQRNHWTMTLFQFAWHKIHYDGRPSQKTRRTLKTRNRLSQDASCKKKVLRMDCFLGLLRFLIQDKPRPSIVHPAGHSLVTIIHFVLMVLVLGSPTNVYIDGHQVDESSKVFCVLVLTLPTLLINY